MKLNRKTAKTIALEAFFETLDRARLTLEGYNNGDVRINGVDSFYNMFVNELEERQLDVTSKRIEEIENEYEALIEKAKKALDNLYKKEAKK